MTILLVGVAWAVIGFAAGLILCCAIRIADAAMETAELLDDDELPDGAVDLLEGVPVDVLSQTEIDRRIGEMSRLYRHDRQWSAWGWTA